MYVIDSDIFINAKRAAISAEVNENSDNLNWKHE